MGWRVRAIRGATTVSENSVAAIRDAVQELLDELETRNRLELGEVISVTFSATPDLDAVFPAAIARQRPGWDDIALIDVQHMSVAGSLDHCIRVLLHFNSDRPATEIYHPYLRGAQNLRPDRVAAPSKPL